MQTAVSEVSAVQPDYLAGLADAKTSYDVFRVMKDFCLQSGFTKFIVFRMPDGEEATLSSLAIITNWDPELIGNYDSLNMLADSPIVAALRKSTLPYVWNFSGMDDVWKEDRISSAAKLFNEYGVSNGVYFHVAGPSGQRGAIGLAGMRPDPVHEELMTMNYIANHAFEALCNLDVMQSKSVDTLTDREKQCIYWTACGKTSSEVGSILEISDNTVNNYLASAAMKLETANKAHTVAKAIRYGLLDNF